MSLVPLYQQETGRTSVTLLTFDLLRTSAQALQSDAGVSREHEIGLERHPLHQHIALKVRSNHLTLPNGPRPILSSVSTLSVMISRLARANIPRMIMAPRRCALGISRSVPAVLRYQHSSNKIFTCPYRMLAIAWR